MKKIIKSVLLVQMSLLIMLLCACSHGEKATVTIYEAGVATDIEVSLPKTVEKILNAAEITLKEGDEVTPSLDTKLTEAQEIVISRKNTIKLTVVDETSEVVMVGGTVADLLEQAGIVLEENQQVNYDSAEYLTDGMEVNVFYQFEIEIQCDGETDAKAVKAQTVEEALAECAIELGENDRVSPALDEALTYGMKIVVSRVTFDTVTETQSVDYETTYENDSTLTKGQEKTVTEGEKGEKEVTYKVTYVDGEEESREAVSEKIIKSPVNQVVKVGTKEAATSAATSAADSSDKTVVSKTAYYDCDGSGHGYYEIVYSDGTVEYEEF